MHAGGFGFWVFGGVIVVDADRRQLTCAGSDWVGNHVPPVGAMN